MSFLRRKVTTEELVERQGKPERITLDVTELPVVRRVSGEVRSVEVTGKALFKGVVMVTLKGDIASAYWSVTPGMRLVITAVSVGKGEYEAESVDILPAIDKSLTPHG